MTFNFMTLYPAVTVLELYAQFSPLLLARRLWLDRFRQKVCPLSRWVNFHTFAVPRVIMLYAIRLYALIAKKYATTVIPTHHARAIHISFPIGSEFSRERTVSTIDVTGWFSANTRTTAGIVAVGTNAELMNGRKMSGYENALAPSTDFAVSPGMTASHVSASMNSSEYSRYLKPLQHARAGAEAHDEGDQDNHNNR